MDDHETINDCASYVRLEHDRPTRFFTQAPKPGFKTSERTLNHTATFLMAAIEPLCL